ncbi:MAG: UDP-N-acetylmuramate dehydrogenase [Clostridiales Family XIII bacterium]|jgi:UDP-N-acetylmuramate dehydrogenase|nr:UDP-N-acetylmuramate dehydrogenase [Clostridiales Family XIII bacterium]
MKNVGHEGKARLIHEAAEEIRGILTSGSIIKDAPMDSFTSFRAGGAADYLVVPGSEEELLKVTTIISGFNAPFFVIGKGTNLLVRDGGFRGIMIHIGERFSDISADGETIEAGAGALVSELADAAFKASLGGLEFAAGIPGSVGGAVFMNAGAFGGEIKDSFIKADVIFTEAEKDREASVRTMKLEEMDFSYRHSSLRENGGLVIRAVMKLKRADRDEIKALMRDYAQRRIEKQPLNMPSAGSFFKRPEGDYAGRLISEAGLKGLKVGGAQVSELHAGFIVNRGGATAADITGLMDQVRETVSSRFGVLLEPEVRIIGEV